MSQLGPPAYNKPLPIATPESRPFWEAAARHELHLQHCDRCAASWFPPSQLCPECLSDAWTWQAVSGKGTLFSFVIFHRPYHPGFKDDLPYNVSLVELEEGPRLLTNIVECANAALQIGMAVEVVFEDVTPEVSLPKFRPRPGTTDRAEVFSGAGNGAPGATPAASRLGHARDHPNADGIRSSGSADQ